MQIGKDPTACCGCGGCVAVCPHGAIEMAVDEKGFAYPTIHQEICTQCGLCQQVCDFVCVREPEERTVPQKVYAYKHHDPKVLLESSSGGAFTALSRVIFDQGGVVYGAALDPDRQARHRRTTAPEERDLCRGSKYIPSETAQAFAQVAADLKEGYAVLFTGTPCQIGGLLRYLATKGVDTKKLTTCDFFCHGTPSPKVFQDYIKGEESRRGYAIDHISFRSKKNGWKKTSFVFNHTKFLRSGYDSFYKLFWGHKILRDSCHHCPYTQDHRADLTIFDYLGSDQVIPEFFDNRGVSGIWVNTPKGEALYSEITEIGEVLETTQEQSQRHNIKIPPEEPAGKAQFWEEYQVHGYPYIANRYGGQSPKGRCKTIVRDVMECCGLTALVKAIQGMKNKI